MAGCEHPQLNTLIEACVTGLQNRYVVSPVPGQPMNGCWSPAVRLNGQRHVLRLLGREILRGLGMYVLPNNWGRAAFSTATRTLKNSEQVDACLQTYDCGENLIAQKHGEQKGLEVSRFVFALIPGLNPDSEVDRASILPPAAQIVHTATVQRSGYVTPNQVVYSVMLGSDVETGTSTG